MDYSDELVRLREEFERSWNGYEFLRDNLIEESPTSKLLHEEGNLTERYVRDKITEETIEAKRAAEGEGRQRLIEEGSDVWYWTALSCIRNGIRYDELNPHKIIMEGYRKGVPDVLEAPIANYPLGSKEGISYSSRRTLDFLGMLCNMAEVDPIEIAQYDLQKMRQKPYLQHLFAD